MIESLAQPVEKIVVFSFLVEIAVLSGYGFIRALWALRKAAK